MVQGGGVDGMAGSGSGDLLTESADISRRILSSLLNTWKKHHVGHFQAATSTPYQYDSLSTLSHDQ